MILSQEELNQIQSINSLEELKSFIFDSIESNDNTSNSEIFYIRILSLNECNNFIRNSTLNGSITKNDKNVWNFINESHSYYAPGVFGTNTNNRHFIANILQDNNNNNAIVTFESELTIFAQTPGRYGGSVTDNFENEETEKSNTEYIHQTTIYGVEYREAYLNTNVYVCFRPVIQYIDNKKSVNIFK